MSVNLAPVPVTPPPTPGDVEPTIPIASRNFGPPTPERLRNSAFFIFGSIESLARIFLYKPAEICPALDFKKVSAAVMPTSLDSANFLSRSAVVSANVLAVSVAIPARFSINATSRLYLRSAALTVAPAAMAARRIFRT